MSDWEDELRDPFLAEVSATDADALGSALAREAAAPPPSLRAKVMASAELDGRFDRFAAAVAALLDVDAARAEVLLDGIGRAASWYEGLVPGVHLYDIEGGPAAEGAITGFVRMAAGVPFPEHGHLGEETSLVLQGSAIDDQGNIWRPGDVVVRGETDDHSFQARPGPDFVFLVVARTGIRIGELVIGPDDPRM